jgi:uncharacterized protein YgbK (DUF1537 family)
MVKLLVIADDLTGANDTGVQFARQGIPTFVTTDVDFSRCGDRFEVVVIDTESRHLEAAQAAERVKTAVRRGREAGVEFFYKKTDSTLRGNIGSELEALLEALGANVLAFAPAYPQLQRTTRAGFQYVGESLIHETAFARDPLDPLTESFIPKLISRQSQVETRVVTAAGFQPSSQERTIYIFDAESDDELRRIGVILKQKNLLGALAGAAGLAEQLPELLGFQLAAPKPLNYPSRRLARRLARRLDRRLARMPARMLVVNGSLNAASLAQVRRAADCDFAAVKLPPEVLVPEGGADSPAGEQLVAEAAALEATGRDVILYSVARSEEMRDYQWLGERLGLAGRRLHLRIAENTGRIVSRVLSRAGFELMAVFGGDTLVGVARALNWQGMIPKEEILPGIPVLEPVGGAKHLLLITKAGGFGAEDVLQQLKDRIRSLSH